MATNYKIITVPTTKADKDNQHIEIVSFKEAIDDKDVAVQVRNATDTVSINLLQSRNAQLAGEISNLQAIIDKNNAIIADLGIAFDKVVEEEPTEGTTEG